MADTNRRIPLWLIAVTGGILVFTVLGVFLFGSYSGIGSSL
jgi:photosystem II PsbJ protein